MPAVDDLADRLVQRRGVVDRRQRRETHGHPLGETLLARSRAEDAKERPDRPVARRHRREHLGQRRPARPPELVRVGVDHPVRPELGRREPRHPRHPLVLTQVLARLANQVHLPGAGVLLEHLGRAVLRPVVGRDHEVDAGFRWNASHESTTSISSRARSVMTSVIAGPVYELPRAGPLDRSEPPSSASHALLGADDAVDPDEHRRLRCVGARPRARSGAGIERRRSPGRRTSLVTARASAARRGRACRSPSIRPRDHARGHRRRRERVVERRRSDRPGTPRPEGSGAGSARTSGLRSQPPRPCARVAPPSGTRSGGPRSGATRAAARDPEPRRCGSRPRPRRPAARWATF